MLLCPTCISVIPAQKENRYTLAACPASVSSTISLWTPWVIRPGFHRLLCIRLVNWSGASSATFPLMKTVDRAMIIVVPGFFCYFFRQQHVYNKLLVFLFFFSIKYHCNLAITLLNQVGIFLPLYDSKRSMWNRQLSVFFLFLNELCYVINPLQHKKGTFPLGWKFCAYSSFSGGIS